MLKLGCFIAQFVLVTIEFSIKVADLTNLSFQNSQTDSLRSFILSIADGV